MTLSLRDRLLAGLVVLVAAGLVGFGAATYAALDHFLSQRLDDQLLAARGLAIGQLGGFEGGHGFGPPGGGGGGPDGRGNQSQSIVPGTYAAEFDSGGNLLREHVFDFNAVPSTARPKLPRPLPGGTQASPALLTVGGTGGVGAYRVVVERLNDADVLVVAVPRTDVAATLNQLLQLEAAIGAALLLLIALFALWIIRLGLRPLEHMGDTAAAIAAGDLSRRVEPATPRTEIGRLGQSLNAMLAQIEDSFRRREASEQRLRRFMADASHELRTPLTSIRGYAELLRRRGVPAGDAATARRRIEEESIRMTGLVDDMLLLARLDQGRPLLEEPVDLSAISRDACADTRAAAPGRVIELAAPGAVIVAGDASRLRQVVGNLLRNAVVHTPADASVEVTVERRDGRAWLAVVDHGQGLPEGAAEKVFEPFFRADAGRSRDRGGSGLGLSIVAAVVRAHHGEIAVTPTPGGGATFRVDLPLASATTDG